MRHIKILLVFLFLLAGQQFFDEDVPGQRLADDPTYTEEQVYEPSSETEVIEYPHWLYTLPRQTQPSTDEENFE